MANEELYGGMEGLSGGMQTGSAIMPGLGTAIGGVVGAGLGAFQGHQKKKARRKAEKRLREALQKLMVGSTDVYGNTLSADNSGRWSYNLSDAGRNARLLAERALRNASTYQDKTPQQIADQNALIAQSAVARSNLRTGSDMSKSLANIARQSTESLRNAILQGRSNAANSQLYNANVRNNLNGSVQDAMAPINSMQSNLQSMVKGLNMPTYNAHLGIANQFNRMNDPENLFSGIASNSFIRK